MLGTYVIHVFFSEKRWITFWWPRSRFFKAQYSQLSFKFNWFWLGRVAGFSSASSGVDRPTTLNNRRSDGKCAGPVIRLMGVPKNCVWLSKGICFHTLLAGQLRWQHSATDKIIHIYSWYDIIFAGTLPAHPDFPFWASCPESLRLFAPCNPILEEISVWFPF